MLDLRFTDWEAGDKKPVRMQVDLWLFARKKLKSQGCVISQMTETAKVLFAQWVLLCISVSVQHADGSDTLLALTSLGSFA